jgi:hypothetical protein
MLDLQIVDYSVDPRPAQIHKELNIEGTETIHNMPANFSSLPEARMFLDLVQRRSLHFLLMVEDGQYEDIGAIKINFPVTENEASLALIDWGDVYTSDEYLMHSGEILRSQSAFKTLYRSI